MVKGKPLDGNAELPKEGNPAINFCVRRWEAPLASFRAGHHGGDQSFSGLQLVQKHRSA